MRARRGYFKSLLSCSKYSGFAFSRLSQSLLGTRDGFYGSNENAHEDLQPPSCSLDGEPERTRDQREHNEPGPQLCSALNPTAVWVRRPSFPGVCYKPVTQCLEGTTADPLVGDPGLIGLWCCSQDSALFAEPERQSLPQQTTPPPNFCPSLPHHCSYWLPQACLGLSPIFFFLIQVFSLTNSLHIKSHLGCFASQAIWANRACQQSWNPKPCRLPHSSLSAAITVTNACQGGRRKRVGTGWRGQTACCSFGLWEVIDTDLVTFHLFRLTFHLHHWAFLIPTSCSLDKFLLNTHSATRPAPSNRSITWTTSVI